ncbi:hypothetical protein QY049_26535 [Bradyrhizobium sp. WYCCWR 13022]|uniref:hypothetical protein n=1 Tax=unclassified Bradyrhizobium TaxID=2631580 RepID=UPI00263AEB0C|nr:hypothetical protein [Bradyrhizobium sp. WYCCWR 13022]MDN4986722.1 hypothetical protein [Bradyrhizobium sp. WYCCWR 13022]
MNGDSSKQGRTEPLATHPEIGCNTPEATSAPVSVRMPKDLKDDAIERAASRGIDLGQYIRDLMQTDLYEARPRRRRAKYDGIRQKLAEIHAAIIGCANEVKRSGTRVADTEHDGEMITLLRDAVSALLLLARSIGPR